MPKIITTEMFISNATKIHGDKYDYSSVKYINCDEKVEIICRNHGSFYQSPDGHLHGNGCRECRKEMLSVKFKNNTNTLIQSSIPIHGTKYDYSQFIYINAKTQGVIICPLHGKFLQSPNSHLSKHGCHKCAQNIKYTVDTFIEKSKIIHGNKYNYSKSKYGKNQREKIIIICPKHNEFKQMPSSHLSGHGCPKCNHIISIPEVEFLDFIKIKERNKYIKPYKVDGYDPSTNTIYEFLGDYWHGNPEKFKLTDIHPRIKKSYGKIYESTMYRLSTLKRLGYNVKYIWESDWDKFKNKTNNDLIIKTYE